MTAALWLLLALVLSSTAALVVGVVLTQQVLRHDDDQPWSRRIAVALLWPWAAFEGMRRGRVVAPALFVVFTLTYAALQLAAAVADFSA